MDTKELLKKVRKIEIKTKGLSNQVFSDLTIVTFSKKFSISLETINLRNTI